MPIVQVFADVRCPFTHVGLRRVRERRAGSGAAASLIVRAWPLELVNGEPMDADHIGDEVDALRSQVAPDLFARFDRGRFPATSLPALALTAAAYDVGIETGERVAFAVRDAMWEEGLDIADPDVLRSIAAAHGMSDVDLLDDRAVRADWAEGQDLGVIGSPHFLVGGEGFFCPGLAISHDDEGFHVRPKADEFEAFVERALRP